MKNNPLDDGINMECFYRKRFLESTSVNPHTIENSTAKLVMHKLNISCKEEFKKELGYSVDLL